MSESAKGSRARVSLEDRFWAKVVKGANPDDCWAWTAATTNGYGVIGRGGGRVNGLVRAHHVSWEIEHGRPVTQGMILCHSCDNPPCTNPRHLWEGTHADNQDDKWAKGRASPPPWKPGDLNGEAVLTWPDVREIRAAWALGGITSRALALKYGVGKSTVLRAVHFKTWKHDPESAR